MRNENGALVAEALDTHNSRWEMQVHRKFRPVVCKLVCLGLWGPSEQMAPKRQDSLSFFLRIIEARFNASGKHFTELGTDPLTLSGRSKAMPVPSKSRLSCNRRSLREGEHVGACPKICSSIDYHGMYFV